MISGIAAVEDGVLIEKALGGQSECFAALMDRHKSAVRRRVKSMVRNIMDEDDIVQEAFVKAWRHLATFRAQASFRSWVMQIAKNEAAQLFRRQSRSPLFPALADLDSFVSECDSPYESLQRVETRQAVRNAVATLPPKYRDILILCDLEQLSAKETARWLHVGVPLVKTRLFRARLLLSAALRRQGQRAAHCRVHSKAA